MHSDQHLNLILRPLAHRSSSRFSCSHAVRPRGSVARTSSRRFSRSSFCCPCVEMENEDMINSMWNSNASGVICVPLKDNWEE
ncbi:hypothetical protein ACOSQ2_001692 [Xanthoceras sorbifolium]